VGLQYLTYRQIDKIKWDVCIEKAGNGLIYGSSAYLNCMAKQWDALVLNDYDAVMPLTWNKKYGICYIYQPPFTASLGIFGNRLNATMVNDFLLAIPAKFKYWDISLNHGNNFELVDFDLKQRSNFILPLNKSYSNISNGYRDNIKRNIRKSDQFGLRIDNNITITEIVELGKEQLKDISKTNSDDFERFTRLYGILLQKKQATSYGVYMSSGQLVAAAAFFYSHKRAYYILVGNHPNGKTLGASHTLIDAFIRDHAGQDLLLDFEGSDIPSLAFFYSSFGAIEEKYPSICLNRLPGPLKWLKKN
jgi:hypothetical protein